jgi:hypothetical protein
VSLRLRAAFATQLEVVAAPVHFRDVGVMGEPVEQSTSEAFGAEQSGNQGLLASGYRVGFDCGRLDERLGVC